MVRSPIDEIQNPTGRNNGLAEICSLQVCRKFVKKKTRSKYGAKMANTSFAYHKIKAGCVSLTSNEANAVFTIFAPDLLLRFYKFATYL